MLYVKSVAVRRMASHMKYKKPGRTKHNYRVPFIIIGYVTLLLLLSIVLDKQVMPWLIELCTSKAQYSATAYINESVSEYLVENDIKYDDLYEIVRNNDGQVTSLVANTVNLNKLKSGLTIMVFDKVESVEGLTVNLPVSALFGMLDFGPRIPIRLLANGNLEMDFKNNFTSAGINQTRHEIYIECICDMELLLPGRTGKMTVTSQIPLTDTIIVGGVPNYLFPNNGGQNAN